MRVPNLSLLSLGVLLALGTASAGANPTEKRSGDAEALSILAAADQGEVDTAKQALSKGVSGGVRDLAQMIETDHSANLKQTRALAASTKVHTVENDEVKKTRKDALDMRQDLQKLSGDAYAKAYVDAMVKDHQNDLNEIDTKLIPESSNAQVIAHLKTTREAVAKHLAAAQALQGNASAKK
jgi:putative membrane protein